jgi:hypothetical protein
MPDNADVRPTAPGADAPGPDGRTPDWTVQATDAIVNAVGKVEEKVTGPFTTAARGIVFGIFIFILGIVASVMFTIMMVRFLNNYLPDAFFGEDHVWVAYTLTGLIFLGAGFFVWPRRKPKPTFQPNA